LYKAPDTLGNDVCQVSEFGARRTPRRGTACGSGF